MSPLKAKCLVFRFFKFLFIARGFRPLIDIGGSACESVLVAFLVSMTTLSATPIMTSSRKVLLAWRTFPGFPIPLSYIFFSFWFHPDLPLLPKCRLKWVGGEAEGVFYPLWLSGLFFFSRAFLYFPLRVFFNGQMDRHDFFFFPFVRGTFQMFEGRIVTLSYIAIAIHYLF